MRNTVSSFILRDNLSEYLDLVAKEEKPLVIERYGKPVAVLLPYKDKEKTDYGSFFGFLGGEESGEKYLKRVRRSAREKEKINKLRGL